MKGRCLNRLTMEPKKKKTPRVGLEPTTTRLTAECSTIELSRIIKVCTFKTSYNSDLFFSLLTRLSPRPISNSQLHMLPCFHLCPIYLVVFKGSYFLMEGISHLEGGFTLRCLQRLSLPDLATLPCRWSTADTPVVRPSRSSRTKDSSSQISSARAG